MNFIEEILHHSTRLSSKTAILLGDKQITYGKLLELAKQEMINKTASIATPICVTDKFNFVSRLLGSWMNGKVPVPIDPSLPAEEIEYRTKHCSLGSSNGLNGDDALILYTSGTTGRAKGVIHTKNSISAQVEALRKAWDWNQTDKLLLPVPLTHVHGLVTGLLSALSVGATIQLIDKFDTEAVWHHLPNCSVFTAVPTIYAKLVQHYTGPSFDVHKRAQTKESIKGLRLMISGSAPLSAKLFDDWAEISGCRLLERYGSTESGIVVSNSIKDPHRQPGTVGKALDKVQIRIEGDARNGELLISGPTLFRGYLNDSTSTDKVLKDGWYHSGDQAVIDADGKVRLMGRDIDIIKVGGYKVSALEVENRIMDVLGDAISECVIVGPSDAVYGQRIVLVHVGTLPDDALERLRSQLASYQMPRQTIQLSELPRNAMGKIDKKSMLKQLWPLSP